MWTGGVSGLAKATCAFRGAPHWQPVQRDLIHLHGPRRCGTGRKGETMVVVPLSRMEKDAKSNRRILECETTNWARIAAGGSLLASGLLLLTGNRRAGLMTAAAGTALA